MREMRGEVGKKTLKKRWIISHFYDVTVIKSRTDWTLSFYYILIGWLAVMKHIFQPKGIILFIIIRDVHQFFLY